MTISTAHPIDVGIFAISLAVILVVGLSYGRSVNTLKDYALGGKNFSTSALVATIIATWITGSFLTWRIGDIYHNGLYAIVLYLCDVGTLFITGWVIAMRMGPFLGKTSIVEAMGDIYGRPIGAITAIFSLLVTIGLIALQFKTGESIFSTLLGWNSTQTQLFIGITVIIYSSLGGIRAVTFTDVIQFFTFGTLIPLLTLVVWNNLRNFDKVSTLFQTVPEFNINAFISQSDNGKKWTFLTLIPLYLIPAFSPPIFQRVTIARSVHQVRKAFLYAATLYFFLLLFIIWIAIIVRADNASLAPGNVFQYIVSNYVSVGMVGILLAGLMAMIMSTADSNLNAASVIFVDEVVTMKLFGTRLRFAASQRNERIKLLVARCASVLLGLLALYLSMHPESYLFSNLVLKAWDLYMPVVSVPLLLAIWGFRSTTTPALIGMAAGFVTVVVWDYFVPYFHIGGSVSHIGASMPGMFANCLGLLGSHYLLRAPGGWQIFESASSLVLERSVRRQTWQRFSQSIRSFRLYAYLQQNLPTEEGFYFFFGLYAMVATYAPFYTIVLPDNPDYQTIYTGIYYFFLPLITLFMTFPIWPPEIRKMRFMAYLWPIGIGVILFFMGTLLTILSHFYYMQVMVMIINLLMAVLLLRWPLVLFLASVGIALAIVFFGQYTGSALPLDQLGPLHFRILYGLLLLTSLLIALFKGKQSYRQLEMNNKNLAITNQETADELLLAFQDKARFSKAFRKSGASALTQLVILSREIRAALQKFSLPPSVNQKLNELNEQLAPIAMQLDRLDHRATSYLRLAVDTTSVEVLLTAVQDRLRTKGADQGIQIRQTAQHATIQCDTNRITTMLINSITFLRNVVGEKKPIFISLEGAKLGYPRPSVKKNYIKIVDALSFTITTEQVSSKLEEYYLVPMNSAPILVPKNKQELPLATNKRIVEAHYGYISTAVQDSACTLHYVIPIDLREVRPKDMDDPHMELDAELPHADDTYPGAKEQEQEFLGEVAQRTHADLGLVRKAIETIKRYHGSQMRKSGEPFYLHPLSVAQIVLDYNQEETTVLGALLHDTVEDTPMLLENIEMMFSKEVACIVDGVTHLDSSKETFYKLQLSAHENTRKLLEVVDKRSLYVKLADRMHNMRTIQAKSRESQRRTAEETLLFFVPLAEQLGFVGAAEELKERCFSVLNGKVEVSEYGE